MTTVLDCYPCLIRQCIDAARRAGMPPDRQEAIVKDVLRYLSGMPSQPPPLVAAFAQERIRVLTGDCDPYLADKEEANRLALSLLPRLREVIASHASPFEAACRLAVAGNIIDLGVTGDLPEERVHRVVDTALSVSFDGAAVERLERLVSSADSILYLCDNAGEIGFDRLLIERLPRERVTAVVKGEPILNDATLTDARAVGLTDLVEVISNGTGIPGTVLSRCNEDCQARFRAADLVISKGQGNYETLSESDAPLVFLLKVKCVQVSRSIGFPVDTAAIVFGGSLDNSSVEHAAARRQN